MNPASPLFVGDLVFFEKMDAPAVIVSDGVQGQRDNKNFALQVLDPSSLEDCNPPINLFRKYHPNNHPSICVHTIEQNAELGKIVHIVRNPNWSLLKE